MTQSTILKVLGKKVTSKYAIKRNNNQQQNNGQKHSDISTFRRVLPQVLASMANNLQILNFGLTMAVPSIVVAALTGMNDDMNANEYIRVTGLQASWLGSIMFIAQPVGNLLYTALSEPFGLKMSMYLGSIAHIIAYGLFSIGSSIFMIFVAFTLLGIGVGITEAPNNLYLGEVNEPSVRGPMMSAAGLSVSLGLFLVFLMAMMTDWRTVALICIIFPLITFISQCFIPETPIWLLSKSRTEEARKSLQWLRGWVPAKAVQREFEELQRYEKASSACAECERDGIKCTHPSPTIANKIRDVFRKRTLKPFSLITFMFFVLQFSGMFAMRPYIMQILDTFGVPFTPSQTTAILGLLGIGACLILLCIVRLVGKRNIYLYSIGGTFLACFALSVYGYKNLPNGVISFNYSETRSEAIVAGSIAGMSYIPIGLFLLMQFCSSIGVSTVPNMLVSEMFPFKSRVFACGIIAFINNMFAFTASKIHYELELLMSLPGVLLFYGIFGVIGFIAMFFFLPETENCSLEDIERHFSDNSKKLTDINIRRGAIEIEKNRLP